MVIPPDCLNVHLFLSNRRDIVILSISRHCRQQKRELINGLTGEPSDSTIHPFGNNDGGRMKNMLLVGALAAILTGILIGTQATLSNRGGNIIGPIRTGLLTNLGSGLFALVFILITLIWHTVEWRNLPQPTVWMLLFSGGLGILIVIGVAFSLRYVGVTAGAAAIIMGQLLISTIVDATGLSGQTPIPISWQRVAGLLVMGLAVFLLLPRD
jgi:uncharacterized membrane protein YdcZ (DUF606 family)